MITVQHTYLRTPSYLNKHAQLHICSTKILMAHWTYLDFVRDQWTPIPPVVTADLEGKTVVVTGANTGLGFEAVKHFARMNPGKLILACRSQRKGDAALTRMCRVMLSFKRYIPS